MSVQCSVIRHNIPSINLWWIICWRFVNSFYEVTVCLWSMIGLIQKCLRDVAWRVWHELAAGLLLVTASHACLWLADQGDSLLLCLLASAEADIDRHDGNEKRGEKMTGWRMTRDRWWQVSWHVTGSDQCHADTDILLASQSIDVDSLIITLSKKTAFF